MTTQPVESISWLRLFLASMTVLGLIALLGFVLSYIKDRGLIVPGMMTRKAQRLQVVESLALDARRRLVIVRCDDSEHLLLLGTNQDSVVQTGLKQTTPSSASTT